MIENLPINIYSPALFASVPHGLFQSTEMFREQPEFDKKQENYGKADRCSA
jgi:hypothetical protein